MTWYMVHDLAYVFPRFRRLACNNFGFSSAFNPFTHMSDQDRISPYNIKQTSCENVEKYKLGDYKLIQYQILETKI